MIDRNCDATILAGTSDRRLAIRVLDYARSTRERLGIRETDFDLGSMLHHDIPFLASIAGAQMQEAERIRNPHLAGGHTRERSVADAARHVMRSTAFASGMPDNCLLSDPAKGNAAALLVDRVARLARVARIDDDGPKDALAAHMTSAGVKIGRGMIAEWSPGWPDAQVDPSADVRAYTSRAYLLDDRQLASEMLEHCRDVRTRLDIRDSDDPVGRLSWQTIPAMAALFGSRLEPGEASRFSSGTSGMNDQETFAVASAMVASSLGSTMPAGRDATIGERSMFSSLSTGNTSVLLLDRTARALDVERGGDDDPVGRAVADLGRTRGLVPDFSWQPDDPARRLRAAGMAARAFSGMGV